MLDKKSLRFSNRDLVSLTIPVMISCILSVFAGTVDSAMVSSAGEAAVSAVSLVDAINILCITIFSGMAVGGGVILAQYIGNRDYKQASTTANQMVYINVAMSTVVMTLLLCVHEPLLKLIYGEMDAELLENCKTYFFWTLWGYPFSSIGEASCLALRAMGKNKQSSACSISFNVMNVIGNAVLIYGVKLGVAGAAIATTISRVTYAVMGLWMAGNKKLLVHQENLLKFQMDFHIIRRILRIGSASSIENGMFYGGRIMISRLVATFGTVAIAAHSVADKLTNIPCIIVSAFGTAMMPVIGQCIGADEKDQARYYLKKMTGAGTIGAFVLFAGTILFRNVLVRLYNFDEEALKLCAEYTLILSIGCLIAGYSWAFVPMAGFRAAGDVRYATTLSLITMFAFRVALAYVLNAVFPSLGMLCVYIGMTMDWLIRSVCNMTRYRSGKWLYKKVI